MSKTSSLSWSLFDSFGFLFSCFSVRGSNINDKSTLVYIILELLGIAQSFLGIPAMWEINIFFEKK